MPHGKKRHAIAGSLLIGFVVVIISFCALSVKSSKVSVRLLTQFAGNGKEVVVFRVDAGNRERVNLSEVLIYELLQSGRPSGSQVMPEWFTNDPCCYFKRQTDVAFVVPKTYAAWGIKVTVIPERKPSFSEKWGFIEQGVRLRSLDVVKQLWNYNMHDRTYIVYSSAHTNAVHDPR